MTGATMLAFAAGACAVLGAWEGLADVDRRAPLRAVGSWLAPLRSGRAPTPAERRRLALVAVATACAGGWLVGGVPAAVTLGCGGPLAARRALAWRGAMRRAQLARAAPAVARGLADALAGGHSIRGGLAAASAAAPPGAARDELHRAAGALAVGEPTEAVLDDLRRRAADPAWDTVVTATLLQAEAGGDLAGLLRELAARLDAARRADAEARSATAQARFTAWLVAALPAGAAVLAELAAPGFVASLVAAPLTGALVAASVLLQIVAVLAVRRICRSVG